MFMSPPLSSLTTTRMHCLNLLCISLSRNHKRVVYINVYTQVLTVYEFISLDNEVMFSFLFTSHVPMFNTVIYHSSLQYLHLLPHVLGPSPLTA